MGYRVLRFKLRCCRAFKTRGTTSNQDVGETNLFNGERFEIGLLWRNDEVKLPNKFYSVMGQLKSLERRLQKDETLKKRYQETIDTDVNAGYVRKVDEAELNETKDKLQWYLTHHPVKNPHKPEKSEEHATQQQIIKE